PSHALPALSLHDALPISQPLPGQGELCDIATVSPDHFKVMGIQLLRGRVFSDADNERAQKVVIIDEKFAGIYWPNSDPLGHQMIDRKSTRLNSSHVSISS